MSQISASHPLTSVEEAARLLARGEAIAVDATYFATSEKEDAGSIYREGHIPQARRFDIEAVSRPACDLPHMLPDTSDFEATMERLGIGSDKQLIVYDRPRLRSAPRVWWSLRYFGHERVSVLAGGYAAWVAAGMETDEGVPDFEPAHFKASVRPALLASLDDVIAAAETGSAQIVDARPPARFRGTEGDSWTQRRGHIRGSVSVPSSTLLDTEGRLRPESELRSLSTEVLDDRPIIATCGSGIAASVIALALAVAGRHDVAVFDGSWAEWGQSARTMELTVEPIMVSEQVNR